MDELPKKNPSPPSSFLLANRLFDKRFPANRRKPIRSDCCGASVIFVGQKAFQCVQCGGLCATGTDFERMSYMSKSIS